MSRAARFLQALVLAATEVGWKVPPKTRNTYRELDDTQPDLELRLPSGELVVVIRELDQGGRRVRAYTTERDYYPRAERTVVNRSFRSSGNLEVVIRRAWQDEKVLTLRDAEGASLEEQLPVLIRKLEIAEAESEWARQEQGRRAKIRERRWEVVKNEAFTKLTYQRNAEQLRDQLEQRRAVAEMRAYADEVEERAKDGDAPESDDALAWASWIREYADRTDPLNGPLRPLRVTSASHEDLAPHMDGWSTRGPYR